MSWPPTLPHVPGFRYMCLLYQLPHPLTHLQGSHTRLSFRVLAKKHVINYWEKKLRGEAESLTSLKYFKPDFMSLMKPHPIFSSAGPSPYETTKAAVQALFLSGRYRTERLCRHWSSNKGGHCLLPACAEHKILEDEEHILLHCASLSNTREWLVSFTLTIQL